MRGINSWKLRSFEHFDFNLTLLGDESVILFREKERERENVGFGVVVFYMVRFIEDLFFVFGPFLMNFVVSVSV